MINPTVLVIEDESLMRQAVATSLDKEGYRLIFAPNGQERLDIIRQESPTVIIVDLNTSARDGIDFLRQIDLKPDDYYSVIVLTGYGDDDAVQKCYQAGVTFFLQKPFRLYQLRGLVSSAITMRGLNNRLHDLVLQRTVELEQRITEITALNRFYQKQSNESLALVDQYHRALEARSKIFRGVGIPSQGAEPSPLPDLPDIPAAEPRELSTKDIN